jgi:serine/threonine protein kinase
VTPGLRIGRYEVGERLGKGGFGVVHLARDVELGRDVAIKFLKPEYSTREQVVQRFLREARAAATIGHAGIVIVFECGVVTGTGRTDGTAYIVMERLQGETLGERIQNVKVFPVAMTLAIGRQLATALHAAHSAGIIHRDLKPDNVFLIRDPAVVGGERCKILDFGIAKLADPGPGGVHTHSQMILGTPRYMSPEQARSAAKVDARSDIYSLGCMLYEMICSRTPFDGITGDVLIKHQSEEVVPPRELMENVPEALDALIVRMLEKQPDARPPTMQAIDDALAAVVAPARVPSLPALIAKSRPNRREERASSTLIEPPAPPPPPPRSDGDELAIPRPRFDAREVAGMIARGTIDSPRDSTMQLPPPRRQLAGLVALGVVALVGIVIVILIAQRSESPTPQTTISETPPPPVDAARLVDAAPTLTSERHRLIAECDAAQRAKDWKALQGCGRALATIALVDGQRYVDLALEEVVNEGNMQRLLGTDDFFLARSAAASIAPTSVYRADANAALATIEQKLVDTKVAELDQLAKARACAKHAAALREITTVYGKEIGDEVRTHAPSCSKSGDAVVVADVDIDPEPEADDSINCKDTEAVAETEARGDAQVNSGRYSLALTSFELMLRCKPAIVTKAYLAACKGKQFAKAKRYFKQLPRSLAQICLNQGFDPR